MSSQKTEEATPHRLREARKKGQAPISAEVNTAAGFVGVVAYLLLQADDIANQFRALFQTVLRHVGTVGQPSTPINGETVLLEIGIVLARLCGPPLIIGALVGLLVGLAQTRGMVAFARVSPQLQHVNPVNGIGNVFSMRNVLTFLKLLVGLTLIAIVVIVMYRDMLPDMLRAGYVTPGGTAFLSWYMVSRLVLAGALVAALMAVADFFIQRFSFARQMRMSKQEITDEHKNMEGNPLVKSRVRELFAELLDETTQEKISESKVVVVNPTHVAIAIRYEPGKFDLPLVAVKGLDDKAMAIRQFAEKVGVPVYENRQLARALHRDCRTNEFIAHQYFEAMAEVFKWLAKLKNAKEMVQRASGAREATG